MDIFDQAMMIEKEGESLYRSLASSSTDKGAVYIFSWLADQEARHYALFKKMKEKSGTVTVSKVSVEAVRDVFEGWRNGASRIDVKKHQVELYRKAFETEDRSVKLYEEDAAKISDEAMKKVFLAVAAEEKAHRVIMENMIELVTKPEVWVENAEFNHIDPDYYL